MKPLPPTSSSPAIAVEEEADLHRELPRPHRTLAFEGVAVEVTVGSNPSTGDTPRPQQLPIRPGAAGLLTDIECSRVRDSSWMYLISFVTIRIGVELAAVQENYPTVL